MKKQAGFTMIELVMVIVILGILAAFALPRFADLGGEARRAALDGALGAVRSASAIVHAQALASGETTSVSLEGATIALVNGYPSAVDIATAAQLSTEDFDLDSTATAGTLLVESGACSFTYVQAAANAAPVISTITEPATGC